MFRLCRPLSRLVHKEKHRNDQIANVPACSFSRHARTYRPVFPVLLFFHNSNVIIIPAIFGECKLRGIPVFQGARSVFANEDLLVPPTDKLMMFDLFIRQPLSRTAIASCARFSGPYMMVGTRFSASVAPHNHRRINLSNIISASIRFQVLKRSM